MCFQIWINLGFLCSSFLKMASKRDQEEEDYDKPHKIPRTLKERDSGKRLIVIIEKASLETVKVRIFS